MDLRRTASVNMLLSSFFFSIVALGVSQLGHLPFFEIVFFRALLSFIITVYFMKKSGIGWKGRRNGWLWVRGIFGVTALSLWFYSLQHLPLSTSVTLQYTSPIFTLIIAWFWIKERASLSQGLWACLAFLGVLFLEGVQNPENWTMVGLGLVAALFSGLAYNTIRYLKDEEPALRIMLYFPLVAVLAYMPLTLWMGVMPMGADWLWILLIGVMTQLGQYYLTLAYQEAPAKEVSALSYSTVVWSVIWRVVLLGERLSLAGLFGFVVIGLAIFGAMGLIRISPARKKT